MMVSSRRPDVLRQRGKAFQQLSFREEVVARQVEQRAPASNRNGAGTGAPQLTQIGCSGLSAAVCAQLRTIGAEMTGLVRSAAARPQGVPPMRVRAVTCDLVLVG
jgi:hypothetical protein